MDFTPQYRVVLAIFDPRVELHEDSNPWNDSFYHFNVGKAKYLVTFARTSIPEVFDVSFRVTGFIGTLKEKVDFLEKALGRGIHEITRPGIFSEEVDRVMDWFMGSSHVYNIIGVGSSITVFSHVLMSIKKFVNSREPMGLHFQATEPSRRSLYIKIVERFKEQGLVKGLTKKGDEDFVLWFEDPDEQEEMEGYMNFTRESSTVRQATPRRATNYTTTKQFARDLIYFFNQVQIMSRRAEQDTRRYLNALKPFEDKD